MSNWQVIIGVAYEVAIAVAAYRGRVAPAVWIIVAFNYAGTVYFTGNLGASGVVDAITIALLIGEGGALGYPLAGCFAVCLAISRFGIKFGLPDDTTAAIVDAMIVPIAAVLGGVNGSSGRITRHFFFSRSAFGHHLDIGGGHSAAPRHDATSYLAPNHGVVEGEGVRRG